MTLEGSIIYNFSFTHPYQFKYSVHNWNIEDFKITFWCKAKKFSIQLFPKAKYSVKFWLLLHLTRTYISIIEDAVVYETLEFSNTIILH